MDENATKVFEIPEESAFLFKMILDRVEKLEEENVTMLNLVHDFWKQTERFFDQNMNNWDETRAIVQRCVDYIKELKGQTFELIDLKN